MDPQAKQETGRGKTTGEWKNDTITEKTDDRCIFSLGKFFFKMKNLCRALSLRSFEQSSRLLQWWGLNKREQ